MSTDDRTFYTYALGMTTCKLFIIHKGLCQTYDLERESYRGTLHMATRMINHQLGFDLTDDLTRYVADALLRHLSARIVTWSGEEFRELLESVRVDHGLADLRHRRKTV